MIVTDFLINHFEHIMDYNFTARVEEDFDSIAVGKKNWTEMMKKFYGIIFILLLKMFNKMPLEKVVKEYLGEHPEN